MGMMAPRLRTGWVLAVIGAVALVGACGLNPQPIPPGDTDNGTEKGSDAGAPNAATGGGGDSSDAAGDATTLNPENDAGEDASDASEDAADSGDT